MQTPWGESLTESNCWPEYPRPLLRRDRWLNLNGHWDYAILNQTHPTPGPNDWQGKILVPFCPESQLSGVQLPVTPADQLWYRREFSVPSDWSAETILLHFGAVDFECGLWINGAYLGGHRGGSDSFHFDISAYLQSGANEIILAVRDPSNRGEQPRGKQHLKAQGIWYTPVTGIWQTVWLEPVPVDICVAELQLYPDAGRRCLGAEVLLSRPTTRLNLAVRLTLVSAGDTIASILARPDRRFELSLNNFLLWSPDEPNLYDVVIELLEIEDLPETDFPSGGDVEFNLYKNAIPNGKVVDRVQSYTAFRTVEVALTPGSEQPVIKLNGEQIFQLGPLDQGWWPDGLLTPPSDAAVIFELEFLKQAGFNCLRKHIKIEPDRYYYHCDRLGLLVWQDMPSGFAPAQHVLPRDQGLISRRTGTMAQFELELRLMIQQLRNYPSIINWIVHNEGWGQYQSSHLAAWVRSMDPSRLVTASSGWFDEGSGDIKDWHDYSLEPELPEQDSQRALVLGEFGGIGWPIENHLWNPEMNNWGYQTYHDIESVKFAYAQKIDALVRMITQRRLSAAIYTQTSDVEGEVNGLLSYDRKVIKLPASFLQKQQRKLQLAIDRQKVV